MLQMRYTQNFVDEVARLSTDFIKDTGGNGFSQFSIDIEEFAEPPVIEICRCMDSGLPFDAQERLTKYCILGKPVKIYLDDKLLETLIVNKLDDRWDVFKVFVEYPMALQRLIDICVSHITKKYMPPSKNTPQKAATPQG
jgi:hypothetical protein